MALQPQKRRACCATPLTSASAQFAVKWEKFPTVVGDEQMPTTTTATVPFFAVCLSVCLSHPRWSLVVNVMEWSRLPRNFESTRSPSSATTYRLSLTHVTTIAFVSSSLSIQ